MQAARLVRRLFALPRRPRRLPPVPPGVVESAFPGPGDITLLTGGSGGGKSRLLAALRDHAGRVNAVAGPTRVIWIEPACLPLGSACVVDRVCDELDPADGPGLRGRRRGSVSRIEAALELLSRVGLAEAWTYLQTPAELSDGQRWRLLLALAVARGLRGPGHDDVGGRGAADGVGDQMPVFTIIAIDEFAALLDRVTARVVARALRRLIDRPGGPRLAAVVATSHDDLHAALSPDRVVVADFGTYAVENAAAEQATAVPLTAGR